MAVLYAFSDGGARGNPGPAGAGIVVLNDDRQPVATLSKPLGTMTNNQAEYWGVIFALEKLVELLQGGLAAERVEYSLDSQLIVEQIAGNYKVKNEGLRPLYERVKALLANMPVAVAFQHIPRRQNGHADQLANEAMDVVQKEQRT